MTAFEHLSVLISLVLGLGIAHLLSSVHHLVLARHRVRFHWLPLLWAALMFIGLVQEWWSIFELRDRPEWNFFGFLVTLIDPVILYLTASFVLPPVEADRPCDLKAYYFGVRAWFFPLAAWGNLFDGVRRLWEGLPPGHVAIWSNFLGAALILSLARVRNERYHALVTLAIAAVFAVYLLMAAVRIA